MPRTKTTPLTEQVNRRLKAIGRVELRLEALEAEMNSQLDRVKAGYLGRIESLNRMHSLLATELREECRAARRVLLPTARKTLRLLFGVLRWKTAPPMITRLRGVSPERAAQWLQEHGHENLVRVKMEPNKPVIKDALAEGALSEIDLKAAGLRLTPGREIFVFEVDHEKVAQHPED